MGASLREPTFLVLTALADAERHGYAVIREVEAISGGRVTLRPGTLYAALDRLCDEGLVERGAEEVVDGRLRRYYRITDRGAGVLADEAERMRENAAAAARRLAARGGAGARAPRPRRARPGEAPA